MPPPPRYLWFDLFRGTSALIVCAGHLRAAMFVDASAIPHIKIWQQGFYFLTGLGHQAVVVFFVLSGFFVGGSVIRRLTTFDLADYLFRRLSRLWIVLIPAIIFTALIDQLTASANPKVLIGQFYGELLSGPSTARPYAASWIDFFGNLTFVQTIFVPTFGSNSPLWSLANEFWYYVLFPLGLLATGLLRSRLLFRLPCVVGFFAIVALLPTQIRWGGLAWLAGVAVYHGYRQSACRVPGIYSAVAVGLFGASLLSIKIVPALKLNHTASDLIVGATTSLLLFALKDRPLTVGPRMSSVIAGCSTFSYSLYLFHFPLLILIYSEFYAGRQTVPDLRSTANFLLWFAALLITGWVAWLLFERQTPTIQRLCQRAFGNHASACKDNGK